jgi:hypothetical protein
MNVTHTVRAISEKTLVDKNTIKNANSIGDYFDVRFNAHEIAMGIIPNGEKSFICYNWLQDYFKLVGDLEPARK